jgi:hypothetical protein
VFQLRLHVGEARREVHAEPTQMAEFALLMLCMMVLYLKRFGVNA